MYGFAVLYFMFHVIGRYPTFIDALRDLDDALSMVFLYATFPQTSIIKVCCVCAPELPLLCACTVLVPIFYSLFSFLFLCSCSYFSVRHQANVSNSCRRLSVEFLHYVVESHALRKVGVVILHTSNVL